jgi:hypothetical protein
MRNSDAPIEDVKAAVSPLSTAVASNTWPEDTCMVQWVTADVSFGSFPNWGRSTQSALLVAVRGHHQTVVGIFT